MEKQKYYIRTFGCQMNEADSDTFSVMFSRLGYSRASGMEGADIILFNTCTVRHQAENRALTNMLSLKNLKKTHPDTIIIFAGCAAQRLNHELVKMAPHVDIVLGTRRLYELPELIDSARNKRKKQSIIATGIEKPLKDRRSFLDKSKFAFQSFVPIMRGCNNYCSYCIVPFVRGPETCRHPDEIIKEIKTLSSNGCREITLLGQNVNSYIFKKDGKTTDFAGLLSIIEKTEGIERIRFLTSHPKDFSSKLIKTATLSKKICRHFHLPLQSGSNRILESMNRGYTRDSYLKLIREIKTAMPEASITTDFIVGYPGESEKDFLDTLDMVRRVGFDSAYTFKYSARAGTAAAELKNSVSRETTKSRLERLNKLITETVEKQNARYAGKDVKILIERYNGKNNKLMGRTDSFKQVFVEGDRKLIGQFADVHITEALQWTLHGNLIK